MKKTMAMLLVATVASIATADIAVEFKNNQGVEYNGGGSSDFLLTETMTYQLIFSTGPIVADVSAAYALNAGETLISTANAGSGFAGTFNLGVVIYGAEDTVATPGYLFIRGYNDNSLTFGHLAILDNDGSITDYDSGLTASIYDADLVTGGEINNGFQVVPEPATIGLFGLGALSAWVIRRNKMQAREEV